LPEYIEEHGKQDWKVAYDARGHFREPHTNCEVPLGTLDVRSHLHDIGNHQVEPQSFDMRSNLYPTRGRAHRYGAVLFIEKEGFMPLFEAVQLAERYDLAIMTTKGQSVIAARQLIGDICPDIPLLVLHDFDKAGFSIAATLTRDTYRYQFDHDVHVIDLGLRIADIEGYATEPYNPNGSDEATEQNLQANGATPEEIAFLLEKRVELNALPSADLVALIERKLQANGIGKVIPDQATLADAYRRELEQVSVRKLIAERLPQIREMAESMQVPADLEARVLAAFNDEPALSWDQALAKVIRQ
jgi:hypothetical protein